MGNFEKLLFWTHEDDGLHRIKHEIHKQLSDFDFVISAHGLFDVNRSYIATVQYIKDYI